MKYNFNKLTKWVAIGILTLVSVFVLQNAESVMAEKYSLTVAPMVQNIVLIPGETFETSFKISNASSSTQDTYYKIEFEPFYMNDDNQIQYTAEGDSGRILDWVKLNVPATGKLAPNEVKDVTFTIDVPEGVPAGGQYLSVLVTSSADPVDDGSKSGNSGEEQRAMINETRRMGHLIYAEVAGNSIRKGEISDVSLPSFLLSGNITGSAIVKNTGNVHGDAKYTLKVYPLFSDEEIYTNEERPSTFTILPDRRLYSEVSWEQTPSIGIFNAEFTVEFEGEKVEMSKLIIICPIWLLFIIFFVIISIVIWIVMRVRARGNTKTRNAEASNN